MKEDILSSLNDEQREAAINYEGPCYVIAGPGSGKTFTIISRTAYMIQQGVSPENILLFTFTNKAAAEIRERVVKKIGDVGKNITMGTYHSVCCRILRSYGHVIGYPSSFTIYDNEDSSKLIKKLIKKKYNKLEEKFVQPFIAKCKMNLVNPSDAIATASTMNSCAVEMAELYRDYEEELFRLKAMDFNGIIWNTIKLLRLDKDIRKKLNDKFKYILADESHDSSYKDIELIDLLSGESKNICFILDDQQSIYSFRGADLDAIMSVPKLYPDMKYFYLSRNYRSTKNIVNAAESMIKNNSSDLDRNIYSENHEGSDIAVLECVNPEHEALEIVKYIRALKKVTDCKYSDIAILFRMNYLSRPIEEALFTNGIPYAIKSGSSFYSRVEIKDVLSFIKLIYNPGDFFAFSRIVNIPKRGIGEKNLEKIYDHARDIYPDQLNFIELAGEMTLTKKVTEGLRDFSATINRVVEASKDMTPQELVKFIIKDTNYIEYLEATERDENKLEDRKENLEELIQMCYSFSDINQLMDSISLYSDDESSEEEEEDKVQLMTIHSSKGLEFETVFLIGANDSVMPHKRSVLEGTIPEERRLYYVGCTRAKENLFITRHEFSYFQGKPNKESSSRFIGEMNQDYLRYMEVEKPERRWG